MIVKLLENIIWTLCFVAVFYAYVAGMSTFLRWLEKRIGSIWSTVIVTLLTIIIFNILFTLIPGGFSV